MASSIEITADLLAGFLDEAPEYLEMLDAGLMEMETKAGAGLPPLETPEDEEQMNTMFRAAHSLKGLAAAFGFDRIKELTHRMETLFDQVRMRKRDLTNESFEVLFRVFDRLRTLVNELSDTSSTPVGIDDILVALDAILEEKSEDVQSNVVRDTACAIEPQEDTEVFADPELAALFIETTIEAIDALNQGLLGLEENPASSELLNTVFRCAHNIKGASGAVGLIGMNRVTHELETVFDLLRSERLALDDDLMNAIFQTVDQLRAVLDAIRGGRTVDIPSGELENHFAHWIESGKKRGEAEAAGAADQAPPPSPTSDANGAIGAPASAGADGVDSKHHTLITVTFTPNFDEASIQAYLIRNKLDDLGQVISSDPDIDSLTGDSQISTIRFAIDCEMAPSEIKRIIGTYDVAEVTVTPPADAAVTAANVAEPPAAGPNAAPSAKIATPPANAEITRPKVAEPIGAKPEAAPRKAGETLRVDQERLDSLMNLGGELVINRARFVQIHGKFREVFDGKNLGYLVDNVADRLAQLSESIENLCLNGVRRQEAIDISQSLRHLQDGFNPIRSLVQRVHDVRPAMADFDEALHALTRVSENIQTGIMSTRMVPVGPLFSRFRRVVRDITKANGKSVNLVLRGENTELDKRMIDELGDPLTHMVRNSVDHGIEASDVRVAAGKKPTGTLTLEACHRGNSICIEVTDDGAGVNLERVKAKILERELASAAQIDAMSDREAIQYIFKPGFSTAQAVTDVSGRGMGMDIVVNKIENLNGSIEVDSVPGQGTRIVVKLPLTMAILTSMVARVGRGVYALPLDNVGEIITIRREDIQHIQRRQVVRVRDRVIPIVRFEDVFGTSLPGLQTQTRDLHELTLVIMSVDNERIGMVVDELLGQEDVVIKSIAENYRNVKGIAGASIRGDGTVSLILDIGALIEMAGRTAAGSAAELGEPVGTHSDGGRS